MTSVLLRICVEIMNGPIITYNKKLLQGMACFHVHVFHMTCYLKINLVFILRSRA